MHGVLFSMSCVLAFLSQKYFSRELLGEDRMTCSYNSEDATKWVQAQFWDFTGVLEPLYCQLVDNVIIYGLWGSVRLHTDN